MTDVEMLMDWPHLGRLGQCTLGPRAGQHLLLVCENVDEFWTLYFTPGFDNAVDDEYLQGNLLMASLLDEWGVEWVPVEADAEMETRLFGLRKDWPAMRKPPKWRTLFRGKSKD